MTVTKINVRATALDEFWGNEYEDFRYLWEGAMHNQSLCDITLRRDKLIDNNQIVYLAEEYDKETSIEYLVNEIKKVLNEE